MITTRAIGVEAIRMLRGRSAIQVGRLLQARYRLRTPLALASLVQVLYDAKLIRTVDGLRVSSREVTVATLVRFFYLNYVSPKLEWAAQVLLPLGWIASALFWIRYVGNRARIEAQLRMADTNIARVFCDFPASSVLAIQRRHRRYVWRTKLDPEFLLRRDRDSVDSWLTAHMKCVGADGLRRAASSGAVVAVPHINRFALAPLLLMKSGFNVCLMGTTSISVGLKDLKSWYCQFSGLPGYGGFELLPNFNLRSIQRATELLNHGYVVVSHPDAALGMFVDKAAQQRMQFFGMDYSGLPPTSMRVKLRGHDLDAGIFLFWLAAYVRRPLFPAVSTACGSRSELQIGDPIEVAPERSLTGDRAIEIARSFYSFWDRQVAMYPAQWFGWHLLHRWEFASPSETRRSA